MLGLLLLTLAASPADGVLLYHVDLARALAATPEGKAVQLEVRKARERRQADLQSERERLLARRGSLTAQAYAAEVEALNTRVDGAESALGELQDRLLAPLLDKAQAILRAQDAREPGSRTVALADVPLMAPNRLCERTAWLAEALRGQATAPAALEVCRVRAFAVVDMQAALQQMPSAEAEARRLSGLESQRQEELERFKKALAKLEEAQRAAPERRRQEEIDAQREALDGRFLRYQGELAQAERAAHTRLRDRLDAAVVAGRKAHPQVAFVEKVEGLDLGPTCDASGWVGQRAEGQKDAALPAGCMR
ncbi:MAG: OmpH family outer membrane protein [Deltaproteobacteria bacterium]|nr:OmpH family outer membrane protein [Deltaproteobacteria bacterium]